MAGPPTILLVEDDEGIRQVVGEALAEEGWRFRVAGDGRQALDALVAWRPDVIVLDLMMPVMDGWAFRAAQRALGRGQDIPLIILSASYRAGEAVAELGAAALVRKPFDLDTLFAAIESAVRGA